MADHKRGDGEEEDGTNWTLFTLLLIFLFLFNMGSLIDYNYYADRSEWDSTEGTVMGYDILRIQEDDDVFYGGVVKYEYSVKLERFTGEFSTESKEINREAVEQYLQDNFPLQMTITVYYPSEYPQASSTRYRQPLTFAQRNAPTFFWILTIAIALSLSLEFRELFPFLIGLVQFKKEAEIPDYFLGDYSDWIPTLSENQMPSEIEYQGYVRYGKLFFQKTTPWGYLFTLFTPAITLYFLFARTTLTKFVLGFDLVRITFLLDRDTYLEIAISLLIVCSSLNYILFEIYEEDHSITYGLFLSVLLTFLVSIPVVLVATLVFLPLFFLSSLIYYPISLILSPFSPYVYKSDLIIISVLLSLIISHYLLKYFSSSYRSLKINLLERGNFRQILDYNQKITSFRILSEEEILVNTASGLILENYQINKRIDITNEPILANSIIDNKLVGVTPSGSILTWTRDGTEISRIESGFAPSVVLLDSGLILMGSNNGEFVIFSLEQEKIGYKDRHQQGPISDILQHNKMIFIGYQNGGVFQLLRRDGQWDKGREFKVSSCTSMTTDKDSIYIGDNRRDIHIFNIQSPQEKKQLLRVVSPIRSLLKRGNLLFCGLASGQLQVWDLEEEKRTTVFGPHLKGITFISEFNKLLATSSLDGTIKFYNLQTDLHLGDSASEPTHVWISHDAFESVNFCSICLQQIGTEEALICSNCQSVYHKDELQSWISRKSICPICRRKVEEQLTTP